MPGMPRRRPLPSGARTLLLVTLLAFSAACASAGAGQPAGAPQGAGSGSGAGTRSAGSGGSAAPAGTTRAVPSASSGCVGAPTAINVQQGREPAPVCLSVGDTVTITAPPSPTQPWQPMATSNAAVLACTSRQETQGALTAVCRALKPGAVIVSTMTAPFAGDPHGPAQFRWALTIHVLPA